MDDPNHSTGLLVWLEPGVYRAKRRLLKEAFKQDCHFVELNLGRRKSFRSAVRLLSRNLKFPTRTTGWDQAHDWLLDLSWLHPLLTIVAYAGLSDACRRMSREDYERMLELILWSSPPISRMREPGFPHHISILVGDADERRFADQIVSRINPEFTDEYGTALQLLLPANAEQLLSVVQNFKSTYCRL